MVKYHIPLKLIKYCLINVEGNIKTICTIDKMNDYPTTMYTTELINNQFFFFRYNPDNLSTLETYVEFQSSKNAYDLEANLAVLKLYQLNPQRYNVDITSQILLKALTNLPHTDFVLCKCLLSEKIVSILKKQNYYKLQLSRSSLTIYFIE